MGKPSAEQAISGLRRLDELLLHRTRLGACALLAGAEALSFVRLRELLQESDGNLGAHLRKLEDAGYVEVTKTFIQRKPISRYCLTPAGYAVMKSHLAGLEEVIRGASVP
jgi:DNA-binding MarR family transcriptional regulator